VASSDQSFPRGRARNHLIENFSIFLFQKEGWPPFFIAHRHDTNPLLKMDITDTKSLRHIWDRHYEGFRADSTSLKRSSWSDNYHWGPVCETQQRIADLIISSVLIQSAAGTDAFKHTISIKIEKTEDRLGDEREATRELRCDLKKMQMEMAAPKGDSTKPQQTQNKTYAEAVTNRSQSGGRRGANQ
jgi:hypothetical protein